MLLPILVYSPDATLASIIASLKYRLVISRSTFSFRQHINSGETALLLDSSDALSCTAEIRIHLDDEPKCRPMSEALKR